MQNIPKDQMSIFPSTLLPGLLIIVSGAIQQAVPTFKFPSYEICAA
jgi:hypothetical protein